MGFAMQRHLSIKSAAKNTKYDDITLFYNWLRKIISTTGNANAIIMILRSLLLSVILLSFIFPLSYVLGIPLNHSAQPLYSATLKE
jgi:hypothetical protein